MKGVNTMKYAYIRVSTEQQNEARQLEAMERYDIPKENYFVEKVSGKNIDRPELQKLLSVIQAGDTIHIHDFSRLSRSVSDLLKLVDTLNEKGVYLVSNKENIDSSTPTGKLMLTMIGAINEFERVNMLERQREGISIACKNGKYRHTDASDEQILDAIKRVENGELTVTAACKELGFKSRKSYYNRLEIYKRDGIL